MKRRILAFLIGAIVISLLTSFLVYSQVGTQEKQYITQGEFVNILIRVLGLEDRLSAVTSSINWQWRDYGQLNLELEDRLPPSATVLDKANLLAERGIMPIGGWQLDKILSKGDAAVVIAQILRIDMPLGATAEQYIQKLVELGIMTPGDPDEPFSLSDLTASISMAAALPMPGAFPNPEPPPYHLPISPLK